MAVLYFHQKFQKIPSFFPGKELNSIQTKSAVRTCGFSYSGNMVCYTTDKQMGYPCEINVVDSRNFNPDETVFKVAIPTGGPKVIISSIVLLAPINI